MMNGRQIQIYDTLLRDGSQAEGVSFSIRDKVLVTRELDELGVDVVEGGYPLSNPKDLEYFRHIRTEKLRHSVIAAFGMTRRRDKAADQDEGLRSLVACEAPIVTVVGKSWDLHIREVLRVDPDENLRMIAESVAYLVAAGRQVYYDAEHFFDGYRTDPVYAMRTLAAAAEAGAAVLVLCDTNGGSLPEDVAEIVAHVKRQSTSPLGIHCHNDAGLGVANTLAAIDQGCDQVQGTINGFGERCGNADLCTILPILALKKGLRVLEEGRLGRLTEVSRYVYDLANMNFNPSQPFVGESAFAHKGGMHVHAMQRNVNTYEHVDPLAVGNERRILVGELSGRSSILAKVRDAQMRDDPALMRRILQRLQDMEHEGYQFEAAEASFELLVRKTAGTYRPQFETVTYRIGVDRDNDRQMTTEATVKVRVNGDPQHAVSEGDGPVDALNGALRKALLPYYPGLEELRLVDYKVRVINARAGTAARVRVTIESTDSHGRVWGTVGVSENIIQASWIALVDSFEYKLLSDRERAQADKADPHDS